jgi:hypothetical protein
MDENSGTNQARKPSTNGSADKTSAKPLSVAALRLDQNFASSTPVKKLLNVVKVGRPRNKSVFLRVHPSEEYRIPRLALIEDKEGTDRDMYAVSPDLVWEVQEHVKFVALYLAVDRNEIPYLIPVTLQGAEDAKWNVWHQSLDVAVRTAENHWTKIVANMQGGYYDAYIAEDDSHIAPPVFPDKTMDELLEIAFRHHFIVDFDHPVLRKLRGAL